MSLLNKATRLYREAVYLEAKGRIEESLGRMQHAIELWENNDHFHWYLGNLYLKVGAYASGVASLRVALMHNPENEEAQKDLNMALHNMAPENNVHHGKVPESLAPGDNSEIDIDGQSL